MVYFTEKLIDEVRERSCIWDATDVNHLNKDALSCAWTEIATSLYSDWHGLSAFDRRDRVTDVKKKWTNIKDSFVKEVKGNKPRKSRHRGPPEHRKKYYLFDHLQFLMPYVQDSSNKTAAGPEPPRKRARKNDGPGEPSSSRREAATDVVDGPQDAQRYADALNNAAGRSAADALCRLDGDLSFVVSLLPTVKSLNERQKIDFKIGVLQVLARIKFDEAMQLHQQPPPPPPPPAPPFVAPDFGACFTAAQPYQQPADVDRHRRGGVKEEQDQQRHQDRGRSRPAIKREIEEDSSPSASSVVDADTDPDKDFDD